jgi:energy-coupling factor transport system ATP-binding protein
VLVFDEPTAQLDPVGAREVIDLLARLRAEGRHTLVIIEHRLDELMHLIDKVLVLNSDGEMIAFGPPREVLRAWGPWLTSAGIWVPQVTELAQRLQGAGVDLDPLPLTIGEAAQALEPYATRLNTSAEPPARDARRSGEPLLEARDLSHQYPGAAAPSVLDVSVVLWPGDMTAIVGANGAGKSTLARQLVRILPPPPGRVWLRGTDLSTLSAAEAARYVGYVFQYPEHQFVGKSLLDDVAVGLRRAGVAEPEARRRAQEMLDRFGLGHLAAAHPFSLSHGEQRRLSVAAMLVLDQVGLLLDEPTFGQDRVNVDMLLDQLVALAAEGRGIVTITHDMRLVAERAQRVLVMADGRLVFDGSPREVFADEWLLARARLIPPPLWELSRRIGLSRPLVRATEFVELLGKPAPESHAVLAG